MIATSETATISEPRQVTGRRAEATYYEVTVTYCGMPLRHRLHNEWQVCELSNPHITPAMRAYEGIDGMGAFADDVPRWFEVDINRLGLPVETIAALKELWHQLFDWTCATCAETNPAERHPDDPRVCRTCGVRTVTVTRGAAGRAHITWYIDGRRQGEAIRATGGGVRRKLAALAQDGYREAL
jgi:hypothetical protein